MASGSSALIRKLVLTIVVAVVVAAMGIVSLGAGVALPLGAAGVRGGMIEFTILGFCVGLVGLYWLIARRR